MTVLREKIGRLRLVTSRLDPVYCRGRSSLASILLWNWTRQGCLVPPPLVYKHQELRRYAEAYDLRVLIETGTFLGDTVYHFRHRFEQILSIELSEDLVKRARRRFRRTPHVEILEGDSEIVLGELVRKLELPALIWLDAHFSGGVTARGERETPVIRELEILLDASPNHIVLVDDARFFGTDSAYPTLTDVRTLVKNRRPGYEMDVVHDIIRIFPSHGKGS